jgi:hypothetical protein
MSINVSPELIARTLEAQGVATERERAEPHATLTTTVLNASASAFGQLPFEQEPSGFTLELRRAAL